MKQLRVNPPVQVSMPESLYAVVYTETAFQGLTQHPSHFHTVADAQQFIDDHCGPNHPCYVTQVPVIASTS